LGRQIIAELFFGLLFLVLLSKEMAAPKKFLCFLVFGFALIVSHYALAVLFLFFILSSYVLSLWKKKGSFHMPRISWIVLFAVLTGMRRGEILNLHWCDVDLVRKAVRIQSNASWQSKHGKRRTIPLSQTANLLLQRKVGISASEYVFTLNDAKIYENWVTHLFKRYVREANLSNQRIRFHSLRHTFATWLAESNVSTWEIQKLMGHSDIKTTQAYSHIAAEGLHSTVNKISIEMN